MILDDKINKKDIAPFTFSLTDLTAIMTFIHKCVHEYVIIFVLYIDMYCVCIDIFLQELEAYCMHVTTDHCFYACESAMYM
ncbi:hypothetical protein BCR41DRAFT_7302 [Lobosporangium transversale]|uniref:Uncharacterized protein n=1 Tax=Lobosporangium transversale TaxID=64571 RepID=A0A1Y2H2W2_9FUNG|nr:hypothetical protein BCR41DRAFT_7302 [Lobosporangium transversale]ORZ28886.1 hypothetical protein BCR41DRAFT_7302 [Lobosporangium transversale]|eukprot:XP_021886559.1 hypothetical protein BCR41DRAFT_7302 [Lobosporangium transversale]